MTSPQDIQDRWNRLRAKALRDERCTEAEPTERDERELEQEMSE